MAINSKKESIDNISAKLRLSKNYRQFLQTYLEVRSLSLSDFACASGFGRGFPGDVISGKRRLTSKSYYPFEKAMKLPAPAKKFFRCLVAIEERDIFPDFSGDYARQTLEVLRNRPWNTQRKQIKEGESSRIEKLLSEFEIIPIFAAAGKPETGASRKQIAKRTQLSEYNLEKNLQTLLSIGLLEKRGENFHPKELHLFFKTADRSQILTALFQKAAEKANKRVLQAVDSDAEFFFTSQFCVRET
ncbi:MAG: hypothetical protein ACXVCP_18890, partial [Bdellovibrio sp.]